MGFWWFGRKSAPPDMRPFVPAWLSTAEAEEGFARSYDAQFDEVYRRNPVGQRAVRLVAGMLGALTIDAIEGDDRAAELVRTDGLLESIAANLLLHGNAYVQLIADDREVPTELCLLRPERVSVVSDEKGWPVGYLYRAAGNTIRIDRMDPLGRIQLAHIKALHPRDDHYGMGCLDAAIGGASVHNRAVKWNKALLDNAARPSGALSYEPADGSVLSADQFKRLKDELAAEFSGSGNAGRPLLLEGGLKWQALSMTPADMDFIALKEGAARDIALAFGVPIEGLTAFVRSSSVWATFRSGGWELGIVRGSNVTIAGQQVVGGRTAAIASPSGGSIVDLEARSAVGQILTALRQHGLIET